MTIELIGGRVTVQGQKAKARTSGDAPTNMKKGKRTAPPAMIGEPTTEPTTSEARPAPRAVALDRRSLGLKSARRR